MKRLVCLFNRVGGLALGLLAATACGAQALPASAGCHGALQALGEAEDALIATAAASSPAASQPGSEDARRRAVEAKLLPLRQRVADACLGGVTRSPSPSQHTIQGLTPPSDTSRPVQRPPPVPVPVVTVPLPRIDPPVTLNHCTGASCLASDGSTLTRVGPNQLVSPRGLCTTVGAVVRCP